MALELKPQQLLRKFGRSFGLLSAVAVAAMAVTTVCVNILVHRFYVRWDFTSAQLYTLSSATEDSLGALREPVEVTVFLAQADPLSSNVRQLLAAYGAKTTLLRPRFVDPDRDPTTFAALRAKYGIVAGKTDDGRVLTDAVIVLAQDQKRWFITLENIVRYDEHTGNNQPKLEQALTEGLRNLQAAKSLRICLTTGHEELSQENTGPQGLSAWVAELTKNNYGVTSVDLSPPLRTEPLKDCDAVLIAAPERRWSAEATASLMAYTQAGGRILAFLPPNLVHSEVALTGLESWLSELGLRAGRDVVIEGEPELRLPSGIGETFFVDSKPHAVTQALARPGSKVQYRLLVSSAQSFSLLGTANPATLTPLLETSDASFSINTPGLFADAERQPTLSDAEHRGPLTLAFAFERKTQQANKPSRVVLVGAGNLAWSRTFQDPTWMGGKLFVESAISWLLARPSLVNVPEKPTHPAGLALSEASLTELFRYVLIYMPLSVLCLGAWVLLRRRRGEERSRKESAGQHD